MAYVAASFLALAALAPWACGGKAVVDPGGEGGTNATATTTSTPSGPITSTVTGPMTSTPSGPMTGTVTGPMTSTTNPGLCDNSGDCYLCQECAIAGPCSAVWNKCMSNPQCSGFIECLQNCNDDACWDQCQQDYPGGLEDYTNAAMCILCDECYVDCDGAEIGC